MHLGRSLVRSFVGPLVDSSAAHCPKGLPRRLLRLTRRVTRRWSRKSPQHNAFGLALQCTLRERSVLDIVLVFVRLVLLATNTRHDPGGSGSYAGVTFAEFETFGSACQGMCGWSPCARRWPSVRYGSCVHSAGGPVPGDCLQLATGLVRLAGQLVPGAGLPSVTGNVRPFVIYNLSADFKGLS